MSTKRCRKCQQDKPVSEFSKCADSKDGLQSQCRECRRTYWVATRTVSMERMKRSAHLRKYGISVDEREEIARVQDGKCAACGDPLEPHKVSRLPKTCSKPLLGVLDHDHVNGQVRGLLCWNCNVALGLLRDDPLRIVSLAHYISRFG